MNLAGKSVLLLVLLGAAALLAWLNLRLYETPIESSPAQAEGNGELLSGLKAPEARSEQSEFRISQTKARPVFSPTRRPFVKRVVRKKPPPPKPVVKAPPAPPVDEGREASEFSLLGVLRSDDDAGKVLLQAPSEPNGIWLAKGADIDGWRIERVEANSVTISRSGKKHILNLYVDKPSR